MLTLNQKINKIKDDISFINKLELDVCGNAYFRKNLIVDNSLIVQDLDIYEKLIDLSNNGMSGIFEPSGNTYYYDSTPIGIGTSDVNENFSLTISGGLYLSGNNSSSMNYTDTSWLRDASDNVYITHVNTLGIGVKYNDLSFNNKLDVSGNSYFRNNLIVDNSLIVQDLDIYEKLIDLSNNGMSGIFEPSGNTYYYDSTPIGIGTSDVNENFSLTISGGLYLSGNNSSSMNYTDTSWLRDASDNVYITHVNTLGIGVKYNDLSFNNKLDVSGNSYFRNNLIVDNSLIVQDLDIYEKLIDLSNNGGGDVTQQELATKQDVLTAGTNITIVGNTISSAGSALPADVNFSSVNTSTLNTSTIDSSGRVDIGDADGQSEGLVITGEKPTITLKDTDARSGMIHMNDNNMYFLSGVSNSEAWTQVNGQWPLILDTSTNVAQFGGNITSPNWNVLKPVYNVTNRFPNGSVATQVTVATNVVITGNFILDFHMAAKGSTNLLGIFELYAVPNAGGSNILIGDLRQFFNLAGVHMSFSQSNYVTNVPAGTYSLLLTRNTTQLGHATNDFLTIIMEMLPF